MEGFKFNNILLDGKFYDNILVHDISYKILIGAKPLRVRFDKIERVFIVNDGYRYFLVLFVPEKNDAIYNRNRYRICQKWYYIFFSHSNARIKMILCF